MKFFFASGFGQRLPGARGSDRQWKRRHSQPAWSDSGWRRSPSTLTVRIEFEQTARLGPGGIQPLERRKTPSQSLDIIQLRVVVAECVVGFSIHDPERAVEVGLPQPSLQ